MRRQHQHGHEEGQQQRAAPNVGDTHISVAVTQRVDPSVESIRLDRQTKDGGKDSGRAERVWRCLGEAAGIKPNRPHDCHCPADPRFPSRTLGLGILRPFALHVSSLGIAGYGAASTCPPPGPPARGALMLTVVSFGLVAWVLLRDLIA